MGKFNGTVIKTIVRVLKDAFVGNRHMEIKVTFTVIKTVRKFLFWKNSDYEIIRNIPYIPDPYYDGEFSTNRRLATIANMMEEEARGAIIQDREQSGKGRRLK